MPISLAALTALELSPPDLVSTAAAAGYSHVGLRLIAATPNEPQHPMVGDTPMVRETRARLDATGVEVLDVEILRLKPDTRVERRLRPVIETGAWLGAKHLLVAGNDADEARLTDRFAAALRPRRALRHGRAPRVHVVDRREGPPRRPRASSSVRRVRTAASSSTRSTCRGRTVASTTSRGCRPSRFRYAQLCDVPAAVPATTEDILFEARAERRFPGEGELDLVALVRALPAGIPLALEVPTHTLAKSTPALERARRALAGARGVLARAEHDAPRARTATTAPR